MKRSRVLREGVPSGMRVDHLPSITRTLLGRSRFVSLFHDLMSLWLEYPLVQYRPICPDTGQDLAEGPDVLEAMVNHSLSGPIINFPEPYMRARDPKATVVTERWPVTTQTPYREAIPNYSYDHVNRVAHEWLMRNKPIAVPLRFFSDTPLAKSGVAIMPENCAYFGYMLAILQKALTEGELPEGHDGSFVMLVAPPLRQAFCDGKQVVIHDKGEGWHSILATCLYPGPSGKKGGYAYGLDQVVGTGGTILHSSAVRLALPDGSFVGVNHEGASGSGKSEWILKPNLAADGRMFLCKHVDDGSEIWLKLPDVVDSGQVHPVVDDMAYARVINGKLLVFDAEQGWFLRLDNCSGHGTDPFCEYLGRLPIVHRTWLTVQPGLFAHPWLRTPDANGVRNKNGRLTVGRVHVPSIVNHEIQIDVRSMGVRAPNYHDPNPFGVIGFCQKLPWWLAYLWRLAPPRGHDNPSIAGGKPVASNENFVLPMEGVGAFEAFLLGDPVLHANDLLRQFAETADMDFVLIPNQNIGAYRVGFSPQHTLRAHLAMGGKLEAQEWSPCQLLGREVRPFRFDDQTVPDYLFRPHCQRELGDGTYQKGVSVIERSMRGYLPRYLKPHLHPVAARLIRAVVEGEDLSKLNVVPNDVLAS